MNSTPMAEVTAFFDPRTFSIQYVVADRGTGKCAIIDPVLDFDPKSGSINSERYEQPAFPFVIEAAR